MKITIGRSPESSFCISDDSVSGHHALIEEVDGFLTLIDLGSSNGTFVNGSRITKHLLSVGDEIKFGESNFVWNGADLKSRESGPSEFLRSLPPPSTSSREHRKKSFKKPVSIAVLALALIGVAVSLVGLGGGDSSKISADELAKRTVYIEMVDSTGDKCWSGSGAVVLDGTYVLTNEHVAAPDTSDQNFADCTKLRIGIVEKSSDEPTKFFDATVLESNSTYDLALLKIDLKGSDPLVPFNVREEELGLDVPIRVIGFPGLGGGTITLTSGVTSGIDDRGTADFYKVSATINHGNSGGPVVDESGNLVAIASAIQRAGIDCSGQDCLTDGVALGLARPIRYALPFLRNHSKK